MLRLKRGFTILEIICVIAVGMFVVFGGLSFWGKVSKEMALRERIGAITLVTNEFQLYESSSPMPPGLYQGKIFAGMVGALPRNVLPRNSQVHLAEDKVSNPPTRLLYYWFVDDSPAQCHGLRDGLKSRNNYYFNGYSTVLNKWMSIECRVSGNNVISEIRIPLSKGEQWVRLRGYTPD